MQNTTRQSFAWQFSRLLLAAFLTGTLTSAGRADEPWFRKSLVGMEVGPTGAQFGYSDPTDTRYAARFNGAEIVRACAAANSEYLVIWARDGDFAYYDSKLLPKAPGLLDRDPLKETIDESRKHSLPVIAYCVVQQSGNYLKAHPEWEMRGADGKQIGRFCLNSGYLEAMKPSWPSSWSTASPASCRHAGSRIWPTVWLLV